MGEGVSPKVTLAESSRSVIGAFIHCQAKFLILNLFPK